MKLIVPLVLSLLATVIAVVAARLIARSEPRIELTGRRTPRSSAIRSMSTPALRQSVGCLIRATYAAAWARRSRLSLARIELT